MYIPLPLLSYISILTFEKKNLSGIPSMSNSLDQAQLNLMASLIIDLKVRPDLSLKLKQSLGTL